LTDAGWVVQKYRQIPPPGVIAAEIVGDLEAALARFAEIPAACRRSSKVADKAHSWPR